MVFSSSIDDAEVSFSSYTVHGLQGLSVGFFRLCYMLFLSLLAACFWAWSSSSSTLLYSSLSSKLMRLFSPEVLSCHSITDGLHLRKTDHIPILDIGESVRMLRVETWIGWAPRLLPLLHPFAIVQDILLATASGCRESHRCFRKEYRIDILTYKYI